MNEEVIFKLMEGTRQRTLKMLQETDETQADIVPNGFNNSLRWNLGHILFIQERLLFGIAGKPMGVPESYEGMFKNGTKPADWTGNVPSLKELEEGLTAQPKRIREKLSGQLEQRLETPFLGVESVGEMVVFSLNHESIHNGYMMALRRAISAQK